MSEELIEEQEELLEEAELSAEELFEMRKAEIDAAFEEKGFFRRLKEMFTGLSMPKSSAEYKLARTELQRLAAPILAILLPTIGIIVLIVVTAVTGQSKETIEVEIAQAVEEEAELEEEVEPEIEPEEPPEETVDIVVDTPVVGPVTDMVAPTATPTTEPVSVKPATEESVSLIKSPITMSSMKGSRTPGSIGAMTRGGAQYGDAATEAAVLKALRWLKKTQRSNGSWPGQISSTAFAVLCYLAHGETPGSKEFGPTVEKALNHLVNAQYVSKNGLVKFKGAEGHEYGHLIITYALSEAYGMTKNPNVKEVATKALKRIVDNQSPTGGWDYKIDKTSTRDDLSFGGWAMQAIKAGKMAGLHVDGMDECIKKAIKCLKTRNFRNGGFNYVAGGNPTGLTATGCLCMQLLGYQGEPEVTAALDTMRKWLPSYTGAPRGTKLSEGLPFNCPQYYSYYAAQCKYQAGMCQGAFPANVKAWQDWNLAMKELYPKTIVTLNETIEGIDGKPKAIGYWPKRREEAHSDGGDVMSTCLCALQLMVYYRYLPTTKIVKSADSSDKGGKDGAKKAKKPEVDVEVDI